MPIAALVATARGRSEQILDAARTEAARLLREADQYCDGRLAEFENDLERAMAQVRRGRDRLAERSDLHSAQVAQEQEPEQEWAEPEETAFDQSEAFDQASAFSQGAAFSQSEAFDQAEAEISAEVPEQQEYQDGAAQDWPARELVHAQAGSHDGPRVVDLAGMERGVTERSGLGQRVNLQ